MEKYELYKEEMNSCFNKLSMLLEDGCIFMGNNPETKPEVISMWKSHVSEFVARNYLISQRYNNHDISKAITKILMFGK